MGRRERWKPPGSVCPQPVLLAVDALSPFRHDASQQWLLGKGRLLRGTRHAVWSPYESGTREWNYLWEFDKGHRIEHDVAVVGAQAAWSGPGRLAD